jgi:murein DD-endopeptidase MepM/ murein hydrolase activator NlpD
MPARPAAAAVAVAAALMACSVASRPGRAFADESPAATSGLEESSAATQRAAAELSEAKAQLPAAEAAFSRAQAALAGAKADNERLAQQLAAARREEQQATWQLELVQAAVQDSRASAAELARESYMEGGSLAGVGAVLGSATPAELASRLSLTDAIARNQHGALEQLAARTDDLVAVQSRVASARQAIQRDQVRAHAAVTRQQSLAGQANASKSRIDALVAQRTAAYAAARAAQRGDEARYAQMQAENRRLQALLGQRSGSAGALLDQTGAVMFRPVPGPVTSPFGMRVHPITHVYKLHSGTDFHAACGAPIRAALSGTVISAGPTPAYGNRTVVDDGSLSGIRLTTTYNHQSRLDVRPGQHIVRGQVIGLVGRTGYATGCHLHLEVLLDGAFTDPMRYF